MKLTLEGIRNKEEWEALKIGLPGYDIEALRNRTKEAPVWIHFGIGNIFRSFIGNIAECLVRAGETDKGILCAEAYDFEVVDRIYDPHDDLALNIILNADGSRKMEVYGAFAEAVRAGSQYPEDWQRLKDIFAAPSLQMVSFTITEKGYALSGADGEYYPAVLKDMQDGPSAPANVIAIITAMLLERFKAGAYPLALVSMDNCSQNGKKLREAVLTVAGEWHSRGFVSEEFLGYLADEGRIAFPWTMIDKITPRPLESLEEELRQNGIEGMDILITEKKTYIAPYTNAEGPQYLVIEDSFPNGRPPLEKGGVYMADRETVSKSERMKVTACLNPIHTALCTYDCMLGYELFADGMSDPDLHALAERVGYKEGLPAVEDPGIFSPKAFLDEVMNDRFPNPYLGDTSQRIATDISQMTAIRFGETIRFYVSRDGSAAALKGIPVAIAGWLRYLLGVDDQGKPMEIAPEPMLEELQGMLSALSPDMSDTPLDKRVEIVHDAVGGILSNKVLFGSDLYEAGIGEKIERILAEELGGRGSVRRTLHKYIS